LQILHMTAEGRMLLTTSVVREIDEVTSRLRYDMPLDAQRFLAAAPCFDETWTLVAMSDPPDGADGESLATNAILVSAIRQRLEAEGKADALGGVS
jgi:hypothetical protein